MSGNTPPGGADPSMDDILASIRKILNEDDQSATIQTATVQTATTQTAGAQTAGAPVAEAIQLTPEMMIAPPDSLAGPPPAAAPPAAAPPGPPVRVPTNIIQPPPHQAAPVAAPLPPQAFTPPPQAFTPEISLMSLEPPAVPLPALVDPMAAAAAVAALGELTRAVAQERSASVTRSGPSIEDVVREELRPLLKAWLDAHLPATVERLVRTEIERVMARQG